MQLDRPWTVPPGATGGDRVSDYGLVRRAISFLAATHQGPEAAKDLATHLGVSAAHLERTLLGWCGLSSTDFAQALRREHILCRLTRPVFGGEAAYRGAVHAFEVRITAKLTEAALRRGAGLEIAHGFHASPFGEALLMMADGGVCGLAFVDEDAGEGRCAALDDMKGRWPQARFREAAAETGPMAARIFGASRVRSVETVPLVLIGTPFDLEVWQALLRIPMGSLVSYTAIASHLGAPRASRAVGTANGRNPISFVVPCHRALRGDGSLGGYYWGLDRKRALIVWEAGRALAAR